MNRSDVSRRGRSLAKVLVLQLPVLGLMIMTAIYGWYWYHIYYLPRIRYNLKFYFNGHVVILLIYFVLLYFFTSTYGGLKVGYLKPTDVILSQMFSLLGVNLISYFQLSLMANWLVAVFPMIRMTLLQLLFAVIFVNLSDAIYKKTFPPKHLLLVHADRPVRSILGKFALRPDKYEVEKCIDIRDGLEAAQEEILREKDGSRGYDGVVIWDVPTQIRNELLKFCFHKSVRMYIMPKIPDVLMHGSAELHLFDTPIYMTREYALSFTQRLAKRTIDLVCALILLIIASPIMLITAAAIHFYDKGPVFYKQTRCTLNEKPFQIIKFRSMRVDAEKDGVARLASQNDDRITPCGRFIRKVRIDELPQLINVLKGEMSFIGPRPERPEIIAQYVKEMPEFVYRMKVKAGLAGYAQVYGKYNTTPYDKLKLDLTYIQNYSVWLDIKLILLTLKILLKPESTEGVTEGQTTALDNNEDR